MIEQLTKKQNQFYQISFVILMLATLCTVFYFWKLGFIDGSRNKDLHKANYILEQIQSKKPFDEVSTEVNNENSKLALKKLNSFESDLAKINSLVEVEEYEELTNEIKNVKKAISNLISFPKTLKVMSVFNTKMNKFSIYVNNNDWRTLARTSKRILVRTKGHINKRKLKAFVSDINNDLSYMAKVTAGSVLERSFKSEITSRISNLKTETKMLLRYVGEKQFFYGQVKSTNNSLDNWISKVNPDISYQKLQAEQMGRYYIMGLLGILGLTSTLFFASFIFNKWYLGRTQVELEEFVENFVTDGLIANRPIELKDFSEKFKNFSNVTAEYFEKRTSFGSIFQEALPLSSLMLDKNLKVVWTNKQFSTDWDISEEELNKDYLSWDYLSKLTNIGENDPVLEALKHHVAGIYQVQLKANEESDVRPYEMFVSPVKYNSETRIMLFFYPLMSLQDTITEQARSIVNPIEKTFNLMKKGHFNSENQHLLSKDFEIAGIIPILDQFKDIETNRLSEKENLVTEIEILFDKLDQYEKIIEGVADVNDSFVTHSRGQIEDLKTFKEKVISVTESGKLNENLAQNELASLKTTANALGTCFTKATELKNLTEEMSLSMPKFSGIKDEIKGHKQQLSETKMRFSHGLAQMIHLKKKITDPSLLDRFGNNYDRVYSEFKKMDTITSDLDRKLMNLDIMLSKTQMILNNVEEKVSGLNIKEENLVLNNAVENIKTFTQQLAQTEGRVEKEEDHIVGSLQSLYQHTRQNMMATKSITAFVARRPEVNTQDDIKDLSLMDASQIETLKMSTEVSAPC